MNKTKSTAISFTIVFIICLGLFILALVLTDWVQAHIPKYQTSAIYTAIAFVGVLSFAGMVGLGVLLVRIFFKSNSSSEPELEPLREERQEINKRLKENPKEDVIDTIRLGLNQLSEYYVINKGQAKSSFIFSLFAIVVGLITIVTGIGIFYLQNTRNIQLTAILSISGTLLEFIGGAYFFVYRKSLDQMNLYFNQLIKMQDTMLAVKLTQDLPVQERQIDLTERIVLGLLERSSKVVVDLITSTKGETDKRQSHNSHTQPSQTQTHIANHE